MLETPEDRWNDGYLRGHQYSLTSLIEHKDHVQPAAVPRSWTMRIVWGVAEAWVQTNTTTSVDLSEPKPIIFPSICLPRFEDSEVKNPDLA